MGREYATVSELEGVLSRFLREDDKVLTINDAAQYLRKDLLPLEEMDKCIDEYVSSHSQEAAAF